MLPFILHREYQYIVKKKSSFIYLSFKKNPRNFVYFVIFHNYYI